MGTRTFDKPQTLTWSMIDHSGETSGTTIYVQAVADSTDDLTFLGTSTDPLGLMTTALAGMTKLNFLRSILGISAEEFTPTLPSAATAQRETFVEFTYVDLTTNRLYRHSIPAPEDAVIQPNTDEIDLGNVLVAAWVALFETYGVSPVGNAVEVRSARFGGRNS